MHHWTGRHLGGGRKLDALTVQRHGRPSMDIVVESTAPALPTFLASQSTEMPPAVGPTCIRWIRTYVASRYVGTISKLQRRRTYIPLVAAVDVTIYSRNIRARKLHE